MVYQLPQWRNRLARRTYKQYLPVFYTGRRHEPCGGCEFEPHLGHSCIFFFFFDNLRAPQSRYPDSKVECSHVLSVLHFAKCPFFANFQVKKPVYFYEKADYLKTTLKFPISLHVLKSRPTFSKMSPF